MLSKYNNVFILGAGANNPYGFPLGLELYENICKEFINNLNHCWDNYSMPSGYQRKPMFNITAKIALFRKNGKSFIEMTYKDGSVGTYEMIEKSTSRGLRFDNKKGSAFGDHYLINKNGELELRDDEGLIYIINKLD